MQTRRMLLLVGPLVFGCGGGSDAPANVPATETGEPLDTFLAVDAAEVAPLDTAIADDGAPTDVAVDTAVADTSITAVPEKEPNDGKLETDVNAFAIPGDMIGTIDPADDLDILSLALQAGDVWTWSLTGTGGGMTPHLGISEKGNKAPTMVATGSDQEHFVLTTNTYFAIVRDARNVPASASKHVGGPTLTWRATARKTPKTPEAITFPKTVTGKLATTTSIALYSFKGTKDFGFDVVLKAERKSPPSSLDSRMSLYETTTKAWILTNDDDAVAKTRDSHIGGLLPLTGDYVIVVENVAPTAADLSYELAFTPR